MMNKLEPITQTIVLQLEQKPRSLFLKIKERNSIVFFTVQSTINQSVQLAKLAKVQYIDI